MDASHIFDVEGAKDPSTHEVNEILEDTDCSSLSTDSMATVRLSASEPYLADDAAHRPITTTVHYETDLDEYAVEETLDGHINDANQVGIAGAVENMSFHSHEHRASIASSSVPSIEEEKESASTIRSRSNSSTTASSSNSTHVDWDELERSEEQAPRDEGSDEVRSVHTARLDL